MAEAAVKTVNCGVMDENSELIFKLTAETAACPANFRIDQIDGKEIGVFEIVKDGEVFRRYKSSSFSPGSIKLRSQGAEKVDGKHIYRVKLIKEKKDIDLNDFFN